MGVRALIDKERPPGFCRFVTSSATRGGVRAEESRGTHTGVPGVSELRCASPPFPSHLSVPSIRDGKIADQLRDGRVESDHIHHPGVVGIGDAEPGGHHAHDDQLRRNPHTVPIPMECLNRVDGSVPGFAVRVHT